MSSAGPKSAPIGSGGPRSEKKNAGKEEAEPLQPASEAPKRQGFAARFTILLISLLVFKLVFDYGFDQFSVDQLPSSMQHLLIWASEQAEALGLKETLKQPIFLQLLLPIAFVLLLLIPSNLITTDKTIVMTLLMAFMYVAGRIALAMV